MQKNAPYIILVYKIALLLEFVFYSNSNKFIIKKTLLDIQFHYFKLIKQPLKSIFSQLLIFKYNKKLFLLH